MIAANNDSRKQTTATWNETQHQYDQMEEEIHPDLWICIKGAFLADFSVQWGIFCPFLYIYFSDFLSGLSVKGWGVPPAEKVRKIVFESFSKVLMDNLWHFTVCTAGSFWSTCWLPRFLLVSILGLQVQNSALTFEVLVFVIGLGASSIAAFADKTSYFHHRPVQKCKRTRLMNNCAHLKLNKKKNKNKLSWKGPRD